MCSRAYIIHIMMTACAVAYRATVMVQEDVGPSIETRQVEFSFIVSRSERTYTFRVQLYIMPLQI